MPVDSRFETRMTAAYREAGHAVVAWDLHVDLMPVSIFRNGRGAGRNVWNDALRNVDFSWVETGPSRPLVERLATVLMAGPVAQRLFMPRPARGDIYARRLREVRTLLGVLHVPGEGRRDRFTRIEKRAAAMLQRPPLRRATDALATRLADKGTLTGAAVTAIIVRHFAVAASPRS